jgi:GT2 family glycosyltransferase
MRPHEVIAAHTCGVGANMAFRRSVFEAVGGFDTALDVGTPACGGGDLDMFHRVLVAGLTLRYEPTALVWHYHRRDLADLWRQIYNNGRSYGVYMMKVWRMGHLQRRVVTVYALRWAGGWVLARLVKRLLGQLTFPLSLVWAEAWGMLHAPWAYVTTYRHDARLRRVVARQSSKPTSQSVRG